MFKAGRRPRRPQTLHCKSADDLDLPPPDPRAPSPTKPTSRNSGTTRCLLVEIDPIKLSSLVTGHPAGRGSALLLQALRQQVSVAASTVYRRQAVQWLVDNDILMLKMKKHSVFCRVLQTDGVEARDQMSRFVNTLGSFAVGRQYLTAHQKVFLPCVVAVLRGRRLPSSTHDQLIATIQKISVRPHAQKDLLLCGMLEWVVNLLEGRCSPYATEYATALAINLSLNSFSHSLQLRFADSLSAAAVNLLNRENHGPACGLWNGLTHVWLGCARVRLRAKETRLADALRSRLQRNCPLCGLHIPYLLAVINGETELMKIPQAPTENDSDQAGDSLEREVDATDSLRASAHELSGARLLLRKANKEPMDSDTNVPGQVPRNHSPVKQTHGHSTSSTYHKGRYVGVHKRLGTANSQNTFVIETERRRPLVLPYALTDGAIEYKKHQDELSKQRDEENRRVQKEKEAREKSDKEAAEKEKRRITREANRKPALIRRVPSIQRRPVRPVNSRTISKVSSVDHSPMSTEDENRYSYSALEQSPEEDYSAIFGARPKVARTPDKNPKLPSDVF